MYLRLLALIVLLSPLNSAQVSEDNKIPEKLLYKIVAACSRIFSRLCHYSLASNPAIRYIQARLFVVSPKHLFASDGACDVEFPTAQKFPPIRAELIYFEAGEDGGCENGTFATMGRTCTQGEPAGGYSPPLPSTAQHTGTLTGEPHAPIWVFAACNSSISQILEKATNEAKAVLFFDANLSAVLSAENRTTTMPIIASVNSSVSLFAAELKMLLQSPDLLNSTRIQVLLESDPTFSCVTVAPIMAASVLFTLLWLLAGAAWAYYIFVRHSPLTASPLDRMLLTIPALKALVCCCTCLIWLICPDFRSFFFQYLLMTYMGSTTVYYTAFFSILLLACKGFAITRSTFSRRSSANILLMITLVYFVTSMNHITSSMSFLTTLFLHLCLFSMMLKSASHNIEFLRMRLQYLQWQQQASLAREPEPSTVRNDLMNQYFSERVGEGLAAKIAAFKSMRLMVIFYFSGETIAARLVTSLILDLLLTTTFIQMVTELAAFLWLCHLLRTRFISGSLDTTEWLREQSSHARILPLFIRVDRRVAVTCSPARKASSCFGLCSKPTRCSREALVVVEYPSGRSDIGRECLRRKKKQKNHDVRCTAWTTRFWNRLSEREDQPMSLLFPECRV